MKKRAFTLVELLVVIAVIGTIIAFAYPTTSRFSSQINLNNGAKELVSTLRANQAKAISRRESVALDTATYRLLGDIKAINDKRITFSPSGFPTVGGSGTIILQNRFGQTKSIVVSSIGRVRIE